MYFMTLLYLKALHIIFIVTWFSGMFYLVRLFIYNTEASLKPEPERTILNAQLGLMAKRLLFGITWPSAILTLLIGIGMLVYNTAYLKLGWMHVKLLLVVLLLVYHHTLHFLYKQQRRGEFRYSGDQLRIWNEVATVLLVAIVVLAVVKTHLSMLYGLIGLAVFTVVLLSAIRLYKVIRNGNQQGT